MDFCKENSCNKKTPCGKTTHFGKSLHHIWLSAEAEEIEVQFLILPDVQKVEMKDALFRLDESSSIKRWIVKEVTWKDMLAGGMDATFGYVTGSLKDVTLKFMQRRISRLQMGKQWKLLLKKDELVVTITTDALGYARSEDLPLGKYYVKEKRRRMDMFWMEIKRSWSIIVIRILRLWLWWGHSDNRQKAKYCS